MGIFDRWKEKELLAQLRRDLQAQGIVGNETQLPVDAMALDAGQLASKAAMCRRRAIAQYGPQYPAAVEPYVQHIRRQREWKRQQGHSADQINSTWAMIDLLVTWMLKEHRPMMDVRMLLAAWAELDARGAQ